jgi:hypothetical protein
MLNSEVVMAYYAGVLTSEALQKTEEKKTQCRSINIHELLK